MTRRYRAEPRLVLDLLCGASVTPLLAATEEVTWGPRLHGRVRSR
jgi:hypothetical protein